MGQLATALNNKPSGSFPNDTEVLRKESKEYIKVIELRSGKFVEQHKVSKRPIEDAELLSSQAKKGKEAVGCNSETFVLPFSSCVASCAIHITC